MFDHLDKAFCILKLPTGATKPGQRCEERGDGGSDPGREAGGESEPAMIRRVDLIVSPPDQYPFALVSWTGSKVQPRQFVYSSIESSITCCVAIQSVYEAIFCEGMWYVSHSSWYLQHH